MYLAPTQIGGATQYVVTGGISMEPRFHTGDLAVVRPAAQYRVGDIVAYHSTLLHVVVLHRIVRRAGAHYVFKGDNNNFIDPTEPVRSQLVGKLWLRLPHGGVVLRWLHTPAHGALLAAVFGLFLLLGAGETQRRRRRRRTPTTPSGAQGPRPMSTTKSRMRDRVDLGSIIIGSAAGALLFLGLAIVAFARPPVRPSLARIPYTQGVHFGYRAQAPAGPVYPTGVVNTGDPIFLALVHKLRFTVGYTLTTAAPHELEGSERVYLTLSGPTGWTRSLPLGPAQRFTGPEVRTQVTVDLAAVQSLIGRIQQLTGAPPGSPYTVSLAPHVHIHGFLGSHAIDTRYAPALGFQLSSVQLQPAATASPAAGSPAGGTTNPTQAGSVVTTARAANRVAALGQHVSVATLRWVSVLGLLACAVLAVFATVARRLTPVDESARIRAQYGHLIVPAVVGPDGLGAPLVDVPTIAALARVAESGQRLILHSRDDRRDTYLVKDDATVYRYRAQAGNVVWGEWSETGPRSLADVAPAPARPVAAPRPIAPVPAPVATASAPEVWPPPAFLDSAPAEPATEVQPPVRARTSRPRLRRWLESQALRAQLVRDLGAALVGSDRGAG
jgi:signal peptidase I